MAEGVELANHWTHSAPCSPSRATMMTGRYLPGHEVYDNTVFKWHKSLDPAIPTVGSALRDGGYRSSYIGKWHLTGGPTPPMDLYGYADWDGNDQHFMGWAGTGVHFDPVIADSAARWLDVNGGQADPWFLTVALVNPHDVMWFPMDQPGYQADHPEELAATEALLAAAQWKDGEAVPAFTERLRRRRRPPARATSTTTCSPSPRATGSGAGTSSTGWPARSTRPTASRGAASSTTTCASTSSPTSRSATVLGGPRAQRRVGGHRRRVHVRPRRHVRLARPALEGAVRLRRDHAGAVLREAGRGSRRSPRGSRSESLSSHVDLARTICGFAGRRRPTPGSRASTSAPCSPTPRRPCATTCCSPTPPPTRRTSAPPAGRSAASSTAATSTPATTAWAAGSRTTTSPACPRRCSTAPTPRSRTRSTSGTTSRRTRTSS